MIAFLDKSMHGTSSDLKELAFQMHFSKENCLCTLSWRKSHVILRNYKRELIIARIRGLIGIFLPAIHYTAVLC